MQQIDLNNKIVIYQSEDGKTQLDVKLEGETVWLNRQQLSVVAKFATTAADGKNYQVEYYNLEMVTSVGYRVKSRRGVEFRRWANSVLKQYLIKGYAVNERIRKQQISELRQLVQVLGRTLQQQPVPTAPLLPLR